MTCKQCGQEVPEGQRFCGHCGADQQASAPQSGPQSGPQSNPQPGPQPPAGGGTPSAVGLPPSTGILILRIFAAICAVFYGVRALVRLVGVFTGLASSFHLMEYRFFAGFFSLLAGPLMSLLLAVVYAWMCVVLAALALRRDRNGSESLFLGLGVGGVLAVLLHILRMLLTLICSLIGGFGWVYYNWTKQLLLPIVGSVVAVGGVFLLLYLIGEAPLMGKTSDEIKEAASEIFGALKAAFASVKKAAAAQPNQPGPQYQNQNSQPGPQNQQAPGAPNGSGNPYPPGPAPVYPLKTDRSLVAYILLNIITCGIYGYYFLYTMARDVNIVCSGDGKKTGGLAAFILLSIITCGFYALYWYYSLGNRLASNAPRYGLNFQENGTTVLLWYLVGALLCGIGPYVAMHFLIRNTNSICSAYNQANGLYGN